MSTAGAVSSAPRLAGEATGGEQARREQAGRERGWREREPVPVGFYARAADAVARDLLGAVLVSGIGDEQTAGRIVETEAYVGPHDPASHAAARIGRTERNAAMFGPAGTAYVYIIYGIHWCLNAVTGAKGYPAAVLIRALEPLAGVEVMQRRRRAGAQPRRVAAPAADAAPHIPRIRDLARGPARLARALGIDRALAGHPLQQHPLWVVPGAAVPDDAVAIGPRIGVTRAAEWPLRFTIRDSPWISR